MSAKLLSSAILTILSLSGSVKAACTSAVCNKTGYACNDDGFCVYTAAIPDTSNNLNEGAIAGIVVGWLVGSIGLYVLGLWLLLMWMKRRNIGGSSKNSSSSERDSGPSMPPKDQPSEYELTSKYKTKHRKEVPEQIIEG